MPLGGRLDLLDGDCLDILPTLAAGSVQCCVTSPPYWGLRDYGCNGQLGLEATPEEYIAKMVAVFREVWRVLKNDGTLWLNMGDSYNNFRTQMGPGQGLHGREKLNGKPSPVSRGRGTPVLKEKDLCGIPWRLAFALQSDGWYLRSDIIWHKPNPMPESVTDRPTKSHEYIFLLTKAERYFYDAEAIKEPLQESSLERGYSQVGKNYVAPKAMESPAGVKAKESFQVIRNNIPNGRNKRSVWTVATQPYSDAHFATFPEDLIKPCILAGSRLGDTVLDPFLGSGTTAAVALELGRSAIGIELNLAYAELARARTNVTTGFL